MQNQYKYIKKLQRYFIWFGILLTAIVTIVHVLSLYHVITRDSNLNSLHILSLTAAFNFGIFYTLTFALLFENSVWKKRLLIFREMGRMALTNYLLQTVLNVFVFYGIGLDLFGKFGYLPLLPWFLMLAAFQINFSKWWLNRYMFGPTEWLWRTFTYGKPQPLKIKPKFT